MCECACKPSGVYLDVHAKQMEKWIFTKLLLFISHRCYLFLKDGSSVAHSKFPFVRAVIHHSKAIVKAKTKRTLRESVEGNTIASQSTLIGGLTC